MASKGKPSAFVILVIAVVVVGGIGSYVVFYQQTGSATRTTSVTSILRMTSKSLVTYSVFGKVFFDYNGNGKQEVGEPAIPDVAVALGGVNRTYTNSTGWYVIDNAPYGMNMIRPFPPRNFRYMCESASEFRPVNEPYMVSVLADSRKDIGLMEGFLTLPFSSSTPIEIEDHFDHDPGFDGMWWNGRRLAGSRGHSPPHTHPGIDFIMPKGTVLVAAVSGKVVGINTNLNSVYWIALSIRDGYGMTYLHIEKPLVAVGTFVERGQPIALSGDTGSPGSPHLEFQLWKHMSDGKDYCIDPYSPVAGVPRGAWIAGTWEWYPSDEMWVSQGYWTKLNDPEY